MRWRLTVAMLLTLIATEAGAAGCVNIVHQEPDRGGIGGTGLKPGTGGIGGTGLIMDPGTGGGIGGTGRLLTQRTGIVGTITGFASICVNGLEVHYAPNTPVIVNGETATLAALAVGQTVSVQAAPGQQGLATAQIVVQHIIAGPVTRAADAQHPLQVMGSDVLLSTQTLGQLSSLKVGDAVRVSGLRNQEGRILASRIDPGIAGEPALVAGRIGRDNHLQIQGIRVAHAQVSLPPDTPIIARGRWNGAVLIADDIRQNPSETMLRKSDHVVLEAIVQRVDSQGNFEMDSRQVIVEHRHANDARVRPGDRVVASGRLDAHGRLVSEKVEVAHVDGKVRELVGKQPAEDAAKKTEDPEKDMEKAAREAAEKAQDALEKAEERNAKIAEDAEKNRLDQQRDMLRAAEKARERAEKVERSGRTEKIDTPEKVDKPEKAEKPEKIEKPEKVEKPEKIEKPEKLEKPERPERSGKD